MKLPIRFLSLLAALAAVGTLAQAAEPTLKVATVDLNRVYGEYWKTQEKTGKLVERGNEAQEQINEMQKRIENVAQEGKKLQDDAKNPALNKEAQDRIASDAQKKYQEFQEMQERLRQYAQNAERTLDNEKRVFQELMIEEIKDKVLEITKGKGATFVIDTSGRTTNGVSTILFADPGFDVTELVITDLNKTKPADFKPPVLPKDGGATSP